MLARENQQLQKRNDGLERRLEVVQSEITRVVPQVDQEVTEQRAAILARLDGCGGEQVEDEVRKLLTGNQEQGERVDELEKELAGLGSEMCLMSPQVDQLKKEVMEDQAKIARLDGLLVKRESNGDQQQQKRVDELEEEVARLRSDVERVDKRVDELDLGLAEQREVIDGLDEGVEFCKALADEHREELAALRSDTGLVGRVTGLEEKVVELEDGIEGLGSHLDVWEDDIAEQVKDKVVDDISARGLSVANMTLTLGDG